MKNDYQKKINDLISKKSKSLDLSNCALDCFPQEILEIHNLEELRLSNNKLKELPKEIALLKKLKLLFINNNLLSVLPDEFSQLQKLEFLSIAGNKFKIIPECIFELTYLRYLYISDNQIKKISEKISQLPLLEKFDTRKNPIESPPLEILQKGVKAISSFLFDLKKQGFDYIYEAKLILVGEAEAGKTTLSNKLRDKDYELVQTFPMTKGIEVEKWEFEINKKDFKNLKHQQGWFRTNIWDFGGQDIMHATHRYFLTKRSLYLLVIDFRPNKADFFYWLNIIELFSAKSPVLIVINDKHDYTGEVPLSILEQFKSTIKGVYEIDLKTNKGLDELEDKIKDILKSLPHVGTEPMPIYWLKIRELIENDERDTMTFNEYLEICKSFGIEDIEKARHISGFLHDLGVILHFQDDYLLDNIMIINTTWATEAVYLVLLDTLVRKNNGKFNYNDLKRIWQADKYFKNGVAVYPSACFSQLLQLMVNFQIAYSISDTNEWIIPQLLPENPPENKEFPKFTKHLDVLRFEFYFPKFMPKGLISRLIVKLNNYIFDNLQWKTGVVFEIGKSKIEVVEELFYRKIKIRAIGVDKKQAISFIRLNLNEILKPYTLIVDEMIPCNCSICITSPEPQYYKYSDLLDRIEKNRPNKDCDKSYEPINAHKLIEGVIEEGFTELTLNNVINLNNFKGAFFEKIIETLLRQLYSNALIVPNKKINGIEYDFIITNPNNKEIIIVEVKGKNSSQEIQLGSDKEDNTIKWFFDKTFQNIKNNFPNPDNYNIKACYITCSFFSQQGLVYLNNLNNGKLKPKKMDIFYDRVKLTNIMNENGMDREINEINRYYR